MTTTMLWPGAQGSAAPVLCVPALFLAAAFLAPSPTGFAVDDAPAVIPLATEHPRTRCEGCGVVEAIRIIDGVGTEPATYEFTVRLKDGSVRTSVTATSARWRVGDRIIVMGGTGNP
jgi:hypothetical protein